MSAETSIPCLSEHLADLNASPENFSSFYRRFTTLRFPIDVAEVLELRALFNQTIDASPELAESRDPRGFKATLDAEIDRLGVEPGRHRKRLLKLLVLLRDLHYAHLVQSRNDEARLLKALADNKKISRHSLLYGRVYCLLALLGAFSWAFLAAPAWPLKVATVVVGYLGADYFYSLLLLRHDRATLAERLEEVLKRRITRLDWELLVTNIALVLGYARNPPVQAFVLDTDADAASQRIQ